MNEEEPELPARPKLPDPPKPTYARPRASVDPAQKFLEARGIGASDTGAMGKAFGIGTALVSSILAGAFLGWLADRYLIHPRDTPWGLIAGFLLGCVSGFTNLIRIGNELNKN